MPHWFVTTTIPYVNARPHLGFALEAVQADVLARHRRQRGDQVRLLSGTDDNSLKNVLAAEAAGEPVQAFVDRNAAAFAELRTALRLSLDDYLRTSADPRHRPGVEALWRACERSGDLYRRHYTGRYCVGCEQFYAAAELTPDGRCPEHGTEPREVSEENWFFRLSRYTAALTGAVESGRLRIVPEARRNEVLGLLRQPGGLPDVSVSRSRERARGWGIPVPGDPGQVVWVWLDALANYLSSLGYGGEAGDGGPGDGGPGGGSGRRSSTSGSGPAGEWWSDAAADGTGGGADRRVHLLGKGVLRFHAVFWPAFLLSAGLPLPTDVVVHDYLTVDGRKISKSAAPGASGSVVDALELSARYGPEAVRWWLLREVPRVGDADYTERRLVDRANEDLANGLGNLVHRTASMLHRYRGGAVPAVAAEGDPALALARAAVPEEVDAALAAFDFRRAAGSAWALVEEANRYVDRCRPWELHRAGREAELDTALASLHAVCLRIADALAPFLPDTADGVRTRCAPGPDGRLPHPDPLFRRLEVPETPETSEAPETPEAERSDGREREQVGKGAGTTAG